MGVGILKEDAFWGCLAILFEEIALFWLYPAKKFIKNPWRFSIVYGLALAAVNHVICTAGVRSGIIFFLPYLGLLTLGFFIDMHYISLLAVILLFPTLSTQTAFFISPVSALFGERAAPWINMLVPRLMLLPEFWFLKRFMIPGEERIPAGYGIPSCFLSCISIGVVYACRGMDEELQNVLRVIVFLLCILSFLLYYYYYRMAMEYTEKTQLQLKKKHLEDTMRYTENMGAMYDRLRKLRHDSANHFLILNQLMENQEYEKASAYIRTLQKGLDQGVFISTGNASLNAILNAKCQVAEKEGIETDLKIILPPALVLNEVDLCTLIGNLMDNALEACKNCGGGEISVYIRQRQAYFLLEVSNTIPTSVFGANPRLETTKEEKEFHGLGIRITREIAAKYGGDASFKEKGGRFIAQVSIPNPQEMP